MKLKIALLGYGRMGKLVEQKALEKGYAIASLDEADIAIDFSHPDAVFEHCSTALSMKKPLLIGTTGWDAQMPKVQELMEAHRGKILYSPNFSLGLLLFSQLVKQAAKLVQNLPYKTQGIEIHHDTKIDAPSGTAKKLASYFSPPLLFTSIRLGNQPGTHTILMDSPNDTITLTHEARSREGFAEGALTAALWLLEQPTTGWYTLDDLVRSLYSAHNPL